MNAFKDYPAAYQAGIGSVLDIDTAVYERLVSEKAHRTKVDAFEVPVRSGRAWKVPACEIPIEA